MTRQYVHLSESRETAIKVGKRHGNQIVLYINTKAMYEEEYKFFLSENNIWLVNAVPVKFINKKI